MSMKKNVVGRLLIILISKIIMIFIDDYDMSFVMSFRYVITGFNRLELEEVCGV